MHIIRSFFNSNFILPQMLVNGTALTAIGELTLSASGDGLKMSAPSDGRSYFLTKSTYASLLKEIESEAKFLKRLLAVRARHLRNCLKLSPTATQREVISVVRRSRGRPHRDRGLPVVSQVEGGGGEP